MISLKDHFHLYFISFFFFRVIKLQGGAARDKYEEISFTFRYLLFELQSCVIIHTIHHSLCF